MRSVVCSLLLLASLNSLTAFAASTEAQNVIFITYDGVRYRDVYRPEPDAPFLDDKNGYPLARTTEWLEQNHGFKFGTQEPGDEMETGDDANLSLPGYKAIFSGLRETECTENDCPGPKVVTLIDSLIHQWRDPRQVAIFASWNKIEYATEGRFGERAVQSIGRNPLYNLKRSDRASIAFDQQAKSILARSSKDLPKEWDNARFDAYTWELATAYIQEFHPRFTYISLVDTDQYAHLAKREEYFRSLTKYDDQLMQFVQQLKSPEHQEYFKNTSIVITTDHGRGGDSYSFPYHGETLLGMVPGSENVWAYVIPSESLQLAFSITRSKHGEITKYSQLDLRPTLETLLRVRVKKGAGRGQPLIELQSKTGVLEWLKSFAKKTGHED